MKKIALFLLIAVCFHSCDDIYYNSETRLVIEGQLIDRNGTPISGRDIEIGISKMDHESTDDLISYGYSAADGRFKFAIPAPKDAGDTFSVSINKNEDLLVQRKEFVLIQRKDFVNYRFDLQSIVLYKPEDIANLFIDSETNNSNHFLFDVKLNGMKASRIEAVNPQSLDYIPFEYFFEVVKNQTVTLHYSVTDSTDPSNPITTTHTTPIIIQSDGLVNYTIQY